jgi:hypothetical protein
MSESQTILAFDIGIRNLAWCLLRVPTEGKPTILGWQNYDLLTGEGATVAKKITCHKCSVKAAFTNPVEGPTCLRHCPSTHPPLKDLSGAVYKRLPDMKSIRRLAPTIRASTKGAMVTSLGLLYSLPYEYPKVKKALETELTTLHDAIRTFVLGNLESFRQATRILLENQPVLKNPTMKSVQILLFATLRDFLCPTEATFGFVHASKKVQGKEVGDKGYASRKKGSEDRVKEFFGGKTIREKDRWAAMLGANQKKSDLCDAFCMCVDRLE